MRLGLSPFILAFIILAGACSGKKHIVTSSSGPNVLSGADQALGWTSLFNGKDMNHWRVYRESGLRGWAIRDDAMVALGLDGPSADIITKDTFSNFELSLEWKIAKGGNSGIFFNVREREHLDAVYHTGPEYQLVDDEGFGYPLEDWQMTGANYAMHPPKVKAYNPQGEWNHSRIIVDNGKVQHWLNDRLVVRYELWTPEWEALKRGSKWKDYPEYGMHKSGHIALQDHGEESYFRNLKIRRL